MERTLTASAHPSPAEQGEAPLDFEYASPSGTAASSRSPSRRHSSHSPRSLRYRFDFNMEFGVPPPPSVASASLPVASRATAAVAAAGVASMPPPPERSVPSAVRALAFNPYDHRPGRTSSTSSSSSTTSRPLRSSRVAPSVAARAAAATATATPKEQPKARRSPRKRKAESPSPEQAKKPPARLKVDPDDPPPPQEEQEQDATCCICMCEPSEKEKATIDGCNHAFCFGCIEKWADRENKCPLCKVRFTKIERCVKPKRQKGVRNPRSTKKVKERDQRSDSTMVALEGLFGDMTRAGGPPSSFAELFHARMPPHQLARLIFSGLGGGTASSGVIEFGSGHATTRASARMAHHHHHHLASTTGTSSRFEDSLFSSDDEDHSDDDRFGSFVAHIRQMEASPASAAAAAFHPSLRITRRTFHAGPPPPPSRSYASNGTHARAGTSETPLEIDLEEDSDDEVQIVNVN